MHTHSVPSFSLKEGKRFVLLGNPVFGVSLSLSLVLVLVLVLLGLLVLCCSISGFISAAQYLGTPAIFISFSLLFLFCRDACKLTLFVWLLTLLFYLYSQCFWYFGGSIVLNCVLCVEKNCGLSLVWWNLNWVELSVLKFELCWLACFSFNGLLDAWVLLLSMLVTN